MLWIPRNCFDWYTGHPSVETLRKLYIPRSPLQTCLASQENIQPLSITKLAVELFLQQWIEESRRESDSGNGIIGEISANRAMRLASEEIARPYHKHVLAKLQIMSNKVRSDISNTSPAPLDWLRQAMEEVKGRESYNFKHLNSI